jgi:BMFP domain-containing protein YqiC
MSDKDLVISLAKKTQELEARVEQLEARQPTTVSGTEGAAGPTSELEGAVPI